MCGHCFTVCYVCFIVCCNPAFLAAKSNKSYIILVIHLLLILFVCRPATRHADATDHRHYGHNLAERGSRLAVCIVY